MSRLLLIDGHAYAYRAFHAIRSLNAPDGSPTNAIFGFIKMVQKLIVVRQPSHVLVLWDGGLAADRLEALPAYKANRPPPPEDLATQLPQLADWLRAAGLPQWEVEGTEADDWIGTYARRAEAAGWSVVIASSDKDFLQLVNGSIAIVNPNDKVDRLWTPADVVAKTGVEPHQVADWLALVGDAVDNIPGVPRVGPKTAAELLQRFGSVDALYARLGEIKSDFQRQALEGAAADVQRNLLMVRLREDLTGGPELKDLAPAVPNLAVLRESYRRWNFRSLLAEVSDTTPAESPAQGSLF